MNITYEKLTVNDLRSLAKQGEMLALPSVVGNQPMATLAIASVVPTSFILSDGIRGTEALYDPDELHIEGKPPYVLNDRTITRDNIVGSIPVDHEITSAMIIKEYLSFAGIDGAGRSLRDVHLNATESLDIPTIDIKPTSRILAEVEVASKRASNASTVIMQQLARAGLVKSVVETRGIIRDFGSERPLRAEDIKYTGTYGIDQPWSPASTGAVLPAAGILPLLLTRAVIEGRDRLIVLTKQPESPVITDQSSLEKAENIAGRIISELGMQSLCNGLMIVDYNGIEDLVDSSIPKHLTQYDLLMMANTELIPVSSRDKSITT